MWRICGLRGGSTVEIRSSEKGVFQRLVGFGRRARAVLKEGGGYSGAKGSVCRGFEQNGHVKGQVSWIGTEDERKGSKKPC